MQLQLLEQSGLMILLQHPRLGLLPSCDDHSHRGFARLRCCSPIKNEHLTTTRPLIRPQAAYSKKIGQCALWAANAIATTPPRHFDSIEW